MRSIKGTAEDGEVGNMGCNFRVDDECIMNVRAQIMKIEVIGGVLAGGVDDCL